MPSDAYMKARLVPKPKRYSVSSMAEKIEEEPSSTTAKNQSDRVGPADSTSKDRQ
jgi:hypothetical protein